MNKNDLIDYNSKIRCLTHKMNLKEIIKWTNLGKKIVKKCKEMNIPDEYIYQIIKMHSDEPAHKVVKEVKTKEGLFYEPIDGNIYKEGYIDEFGYYAIKPECRWDFVSDATVFIMTKSEEEALNKFLLMKILFVASEITMKNEEQLKVNWKYDTKFTRYKFYYEFVIKAYCHIETDEELEKRIKKYTEKLNNIAGKTFWTFDKNIMEFFPLKQTDIKK